jgi:2-dehydropantoate 2-reductase
MPLSFLLFGAGAIGAYVGGSLALAGHKVVFLEQPAAAELLRQQGLRLQFKDQEHHLPHPQVAAAVETALALGPFDAAVFALKSFDTASALKQLAPFSRDLPPFLCLQNGVDNEPLLAETLGPEKVIAGTVTSAIGRRGIGSIVLEKRRGLGIDGNHPLSKSLVHALNEANLNAFLYPNPASMKWSKLLSNLTGNATSAIFNLHPAEVFASPPLFELEREQQREALRVMRAQGLGPVNLPRTPIRLLAFGMEKLPSALARPLLERVMRKGRGGKMPSFHIDLHSGRGSSEVEYLNGAVVRHGERLGIPTPVNRLLTETLLALTRGEIPLDSYAKEPERLLEGLGRNSEAHRSR